MADTKISSLDELTSPASNDELVIVDKSDTTMGASGTDKKILVSNIKPSEITPATTTVGTKFDFSEGTNNGTNKVTVKAPDSVSSDKTVTLPDTTGTVALTSDVPVKATGAEINTGTDDAKFATAKAITDSIIFNAPQGFLLNGKISVTDSGSGLVVAIKTLAGTDPSATDPVKVRIGDTIRTISSALSVTKSDGTNWCNAGSAEFATKEIDYFVYLGYNATDGVVIGFSRIPSANQYSHFSATTTNEKYCAISTITTAASTDYYEVIGRFAATLSAGAGYTWSVPTFTATNLIQRPIYETRYLAYSPTGPTNTTMLGRYILTQRNAFVTIKGTLTGAPTWTTQPTLPMSASANINIADTDYNAVGVGGYLDNGTANKTLGIIPHVAVSATTVRLDSQSSSSVVTPTVPITWASGDVWWVKFDYEI